MFYNGVFIIDEFNRDFLAVSEFNGNNIQFPIYFFDFFTDVEMFVIFFRTLRYVIHMKMEEGIHFDQVELLWNMVPRA